MTDEEKKAIEYLESRLIVLQYNGQFCTENAIEIALNLIQKQQEEIEKKDKIINEMISEIYLRTHTKEKGCDFQNNQNCLKYNSCTECIYKYYEKKIEE